MTLSPSTDISVLTESKIRMQIMYSPLCTLSYLMEPIPLSFSSVVKMLHGSFRESIEGERQMRLTQGWAG